jgi:FKBP-type peptidyl-prolyl cis-trans isomerase
MKVFNVRTRRAEIAGAAALILALSGCVVDSLDDEGGPEVGDIAFAPLLGIDLAEFTETSSGLLIRDEVVGDGETANPGMTILLVIQGWLPNGTVFQPETEFEHTLGGGVTIAGFDEGTTNMKVGGIRWIIVPPELAWREAGNPTAGIPGNSWVVFKMEFIEVP